jgi:site-specific recombinase XerD
MYFQKQLKENSPKFDNIKKDFEEFKMRGQDYLQQFLFDCGLRNLSAKTLQSYESILNLFIHWLEKENIPFDKVDKMVIRNYLHHVQEKGYSPFTIKSLQTHLKLFFKNILPI